MSFNEKARKIWKDPVLSKVISVIIIALFGGLYALIWKFNINDPLSWVLSIFISLSLFIIFRYILKKIIFHEDVSNSILTSEKEFNIESPLELHIEKKEDKKEKHVEEKANDELIKSKYNWLDSDLLFAQCIAQTFPGDRDVIWYNSFDAVRRLNLFFENFRREEPYGDAVWWRRGSQAFPVKKAEILDVDKIFLGNDRFKISRMAVFVSPSYYKHFIYIEAEAEPPTGLYPEITDSYIKAIQNSHDYLTEEYGEFNGRLITRQEYDDGASVYDGNVIQHDRKALLRVRYLTKVNFVLTPKNSPYNNRKFEMGSIDLFNESLHSGESIHKLFEFMDTFQKSDMPENRQIQ